MKKRAAVILSVILLIATLSVMLTGCLKIAMRESNILSRIRDAGGEISYEKAPPMTAEGQTAYQIGDIILAKIRIDDNTYQVYVYFCLNDAAADWVYDCCKAFKDKAEGFQEWQTYRYDNTIMYGEAKALTIARSY